MVLHREGYSEPNPFIAPRTIMKGVITALT